MTVSNTTSRNQYTATSGQTVFPYTFEVFDKDDLVVLKNGTTLSEGTDYTVSGVGVDSGGNVTLVVGATAGDIITIYRDMALQRLTDYQTSGDFLAQEVNDDFDRIWLALQQGAQDSDRAIVKPITDAASIDMTLPSAADRANSYLTFDATGAPSVVAAGDPSAPDAITRQDFTGDGSTLVYTLASAPGAAGAGVMIFIDGIQQDKDSYTITGTTLTFSEAPPLNSNINLVQLKATDIGEADSASVTYIPAGTGAVQTSVQSKLRETVSVKDFGAVGDGVTDDTAAIQAAIDSGAYHVKIPSGTYKTTSNIVLVANQKISGDSFEQTILNFQGASGHVIKGTSIGNVCLEDITVQNSPDGSGIYLDGCSGFYLNRISSKSNNQQGFFFRNSTNTSQVSCCEAVSNSEHGFRIIGDNNTFSQCRSYSNSKMGFLVECETVSGTDHSANNNGFDLCDAKSNGYSGFRESVTSWSGSVGPSYNRYTNCTAELNGTTNQYNGFDTTWKSIGTTYSACTASNNEEHGFAIQGNIGGSLTGCISSGNGSCGFMTQNSVSPSSQKTTKMGFVNCYASSNGGSAISGRESNFLFIDTTDRCFIIGGSAYNAQGGGYGIEFQSSITNCSAIKVQLEGNGAGDVYNSSTNNPIETYGSSAPSGTRGKGDVHINVSTDQGRNEKWVRTASAWELVGQLGYRSSGSSPSGAFTPRFIGEEFLETSTPRWYKSTGATASDWVALN